MKTPAYRFTKNLRALLAVFSVACMSLSASADIFDVTTPRRVSVHDPSVVVGYRLNGKVTGVPAEGAQKVYYIYGSHKAWAQSTDLQNWTTFTNNLSNNYANVFSADAAWSALGGTQNGDQYNVSGNLWAPDVIWNKDMGKWCMYMSVNGDDWYSSIVLLTADSPTGSWTRVGPVVYSGFTNATEAAMTDFYTVYPGTDFPGRYNFNRGGVHTYGTNAIDPCVFYDEDDELWMTYGSWFGGIYMLRLDKTTGLRDYTYTYETTDGTATGSTSDIYQGLKIAGGNHCSGEASYIQYIDGRYYLFVTYGGLQANGGYSMRVFSSDNVTGPYKDRAGHPAIWSSANSNAGNPALNIGSRLMSYYKWDLQGFGYVAQGHNSALVDDDGRAYVVYHTRFTNAGEGHEVRVHQLFSLPSGGLVAAPYEYTGESLSAAPYTADEVAGTYRVMHHTGTNYAALECRTEKTMHLNADGTVTGDYKGTWSLDAESPRITFKLGVVTYEGVLLEQKMEGLNYNNLCFTVLGTNDIPIWGYRDITDMVAEAALESCSLPISEQSVLATYTGAAQYNEAAAVTDITTQTGLSLSFLVSGLNSDWDEIARSTDGQLTLFLSVLRYKDADFYEAAATVAPGSPVTTDLWRAFLGGRYYATVSYNPDGTISFFRDGVKLFTYASALAPSYGSGVTPADIAAAAIDYYRNGKLDFTRGVFNVVVGYSAAYDAELQAAVMPVAIDPDGGEQLYNIYGQPVDRDYRGLVISRSGKRYNR